MGELWILVILAVVAILNADYPVFWMFVGVVVAVLLGAGTSPYLLAGFIALVTSAVYMHREATRRNAEERERRIRTLEIADVDRMDGIEFEHYVCQLLRHQGYTAEVTPPSNDFGVDVVASRAGERFAVQAKRQNGKVSRRAVSDAVAGQAHYRCDRAMVVSNSFFSNGALELAKSTGCALIDRNELAEWILSFQLRGSELPGSGEHVTIRRASSFDETTLVQSERTVFSNQPSAVVATSQRDTSDADVIPQSIAESISLKAAADWPDDYVTQMDQIEEQRAAYLRVSRYRDPEGVPTQVVDRIVFNAQANWPSDFEMQYEEITEQVSAFIKLQRAPQPLPVLGS